MCSIVIKVIERAKVHPGRTTMLTTSMRRLTPMLHQSMKIHFRQNGRTYIAVRSSGNMNNFSKYIRCGNILGNVSPFARCPFEQKRTFMFAKRKKRKRKSFLKKQSDAATAKEPALFSQTFKKFNLRVHPDHFSSYPEQQVSGFRIFCSGHMPTTFVIVPDRAPTRTLCHFSTELFRTLKRKVVHVIAESKKLTPERKSLHRHERRNIEFNVLYKDSSRPA